jgi:hypothetical protein
MHRPGGHPQTLPASSWELLLLLPILEFLDLFGHVNGAFQKTPGQDRCLDINGTCPQD